MSQGFPALDTDAQASARHLARLMVLLESDEIGREAVADYRSRLLRGVIEPEERAA